MNPKEIYFYSRHKLHHYKVRAIHAVRQVLPQKKQLLFSFGGITAHWQGIGCELYLQEEVFRQFIQNCDAVVRKLGGNSLIPHFENKDPDFFNDESNVIFGIVSLHIAYFELLKSKGILPNAVMGISLGEIAAGYAAGSFSLEDALQLAASGAQIHTRVKKDYVPLFLQTSLTDAEQISEKSPVDLAVFYEISKDGVLAFCRQEQKEIAIDFLKSQKISYYNIPQGTPCYPYHTKLLLPYEAFLKNFSKGVEAKPLKCDVYSSLRGKILPEGTIIDRDYFFEEKSRPILAHSIVQKIKGPQVILNIGPSSLLRNHVDQLKERQAQFFDTFLPKESESALFKTAEQQLLKMKWAPSSLNSYESNELAPFLKKFNFYAVQSMQDPLPYLKYLQKKGSIHYLPQHGEWFVLDYQDVEYVVKTPEIFSSTIHKTIDEFLLGADPPSHTRVRSLLQPLFSQQRFTMVAEYVSGKASELLENLDGKPAFNFVEEFSLPLSQAAIAKFMGFTKDESIAINQCLGNHPYEIKFFDALREYCTSYLENPEVAKTNPVAALLLSAVSEKKISQEGAVSLMRLLWFAGMITTSLLMSTAVLFLLKNPEMVRKLRQDEQLLNKFIEECLRLDAPETEARRITTRETQLAGQVLPAGAAIVLKLKAANRDPKYFENPDEICLDRSTKKHLAFGGGYHYCLGAGMARIEVRVALKLILEKLPEWKIDQKGEAYFMSHNFRAISNLPVIVTHLTNESKTAV